MNGLGNDFVIMDSRKENVPMTSDFMKKISDRRIGVGCDQAIVLGHSDNADVFMHIYNQDGSRAGACGNATRCVAKIIMNELRTEGCAVETDAGVLSCKMVDDLVRVNMGVPITDWKSIPLSHDMDTNIVNTGLDVGAGYCVSMGNPHIVFLCEDADNIDLPVLGMQTENHTFFPERTNVEFISPLKNGAIRMRVWERGGMITKACGSGACAVFVASAYYGIGKEINGEVQVLMDGGALFMSYAPNGGVYMRGDVAINFKGIYVYD